MDVCPNCNDEWERVALHWRRGACDYPEIEDRKMELLRGLLMSDGYMQRDGISQNFCVEMTNKPFLDWFDNQLGWLSNGVTLRRTADEAAESLGRENNGTYSDSHYLSTKRHPELEPLAKWYDTGEKVWPDSVTPFELKMLYVGDGSLRQQRSGERYWTQISASNEMNRIENTRRLFAPYGIEPKFDQHIIRFDADNTEIFFDVIGESVPGFDYKWPDNN